MGGNLMRAVTFADPVLTDLVNSSLVAAWNNQNPTLNLGNAAQQPKPTPEQVAAYPLGGGSGNMRAYFATPNGQIIHYMQGYWSPKHLRAEIEFALDLYQGLIEQQSASAKLIAAKSLDERIALAVKQQATLASSFPEEFSKPVHSSEIRKRHAALGLKVASYNMAKSMVGQEIKGVLTMLMQQNLMRGIIK
jgi:hypothetical protein